MGFFKRPLLGVDEYYMAVEALVLVTALGCLVCLLRSIFKRNRKVVIVSQQGGDQITVSRDAITSQATHVIEEDGTFKARRVRVWAKKRGHVRVYARVQPQMTVDTVRAGEELHDKLVAGLTTVCGENVDSVDLEFTNAAEYTPTPDASYAYGYDYAAATPATDAVTPAASEPAKPAEPSEPAAAEPVPAATADAGEKDEGDAAATGAGATDDAAAEAPATDAKPDGPAEDAPVEKGEAAAPEEGSEITVPMGRYAGKGSEPTGEE